MKAYNCSFYSVAELMTTTGVGITCSYLWFERFENLSSVDIRVRFWKRKSNTQNTLHRWLPDDSKADISNYKTTMGQKYHRMIGLIIHCSQGKGSFPEEMVMVICSVHKNMTVTMTTLHWKHSVCMIIRNKSPLQKMLSKLFQKLVQYKTEALHPMYRQVQEEYRKKNKPRVVTNLFPFVLHMRFY